MKPLKSSLLSTDLTIKSEFAFEPLTIKVSLLCELVILQVTPLAKSIWLKIDISSTKDADISVVVATLISKVAPPLKLTPL